MNKVYVITTGSYSDYGINAIFSQRELVEEYKKRYDRDTSSRDGAEIEEWELDEPIPETGIGIFMNKEGDTIAFEERFGAQWGFRWFTDREKISYLHWIVQTDDLVRAVKVVNEKRTIILANNTWGDNEKTRRLFK